jgi:diguanylate cyclase (GGDEF)-like protein/PAS domain S-box-containing protein
MQQEDLSVMRTFAERQKGDDIFRFLTENSSDIIVLHASDTTMLYISPIVEKILGYQPDECVDMKPAAFIHQDDLADLSDRFRSVFREKHSSDIMTVVYRARNKLGNYHWLETTFRSVFLPDGTLEGFISVTRDITDRKEREQHLILLNQQLQQWSFIDGLTGIGNRRYFDDTLSKEWSRGLRHHYPLTLVLFDVDYFKKYNDNCGHQKGDECLKAIAAATAETFPRKTDFVGRYGGEEFVVILPNTPEEMSVKLCEKLRSNIESLRIPHPASDVSDVVTVSIGAAHLLPTLEGDPSQLVAFADKALYEAKRAGRNRVVMHGMT